MATHETVCRPTSLAERILNIRDEWRKKAGFALIDPAAAADIETLARYALEALGEE